MCNIEFHECMPNCYIISETTQKWTKIKTTIKHKFNLCILIEIFDEFGIVIREKIRYRNYYVRESESFDGLKDDTVVIAENCNRNYWYLDGSLDSDGVVWNVACIEIFNSSFE